MRWRVNCVVSACLCLRWLVYPALDLHTIPHHSHWNSVFCLLVDFFASGCFWVICELTYCRPVRPSREKLHKGQYQVKFSSWICLSALLVSALVLDAVCFSLIAMLTKLRHPSLSATRSRQLLMSTFTLTKSLFRRSIHLFFGFCWGRYYLLTYLPCNCIGFNYKSAFEYWSP